MSNLTVTNINGQDVDAGQAKAWANYDGKVNIIEDSFNLSSTIDQGTGQYRFSYSNPFASTAYCTGGDASDTQGNWLGKHPRTYDQTTTAEAITIQIVNHANAAQDANAVTPIFYGDLA